MKIFVVGDLHLSFGITGKKMDKFGEDWHDHPSLLEKSWDSSIQPDDIVLIPGDISWAMRLEQAKPDFDWIEARPGRKVLIRGNHDYWWDSISKIRKTLPSSIRIIQNDSVLFEDVAICGARLWDSQEYGFGSIIDFKEIEGQKSQLNDMPGKLSEEILRENEAIFERELLRLEMSLKSIPQNATYRIAMTHYPPIGLDLAPSRASRLLEQYGINCCVFGHLHSIRKEMKELFGEARGIRYLLTSCDYLKSKPTQIR